MEAGFTPVEAIHIATSNGAQFLGELSRIGTLAPGKDADLVVLRGAPCSNIKDIEKVEAVFKEEWATTRPSSLIPCEEKSACAESHCFRWLQHSAAREYSPNAERCIPTSDLIHDLPRIARFSAYGSCQVRACPKCF